MEIVIDTSDSVPVFAQLINQIKKAVLSGELSSGAALPSIRQLANDMGPEPQHGGQGLSAIGTRCGH